MGKPGCQSTEASGSELVRGALISGSQMEN